MKIRSGMMPPSGARRPERAALDALAADLEARLDKAALPGAGLDAPAMHRLNRTEYANAIRDLLALDVDVAVLLPADASSDGFDNIADALSVSPSLIQGYVTAAMKISRRAIGDRTLTPTQVTYPAPGGLAQDRHIEGLPLGTRGGMLVKHTFPLDAEYEFSVDGRHRVWRPGGRRPSGRRHARRREDRDDDAAEFPRQRDRRTAHDRRGARGQGALGRRGRGLLGLPRQFAVYARRRHPDRRHHRPVQGHERGRHTEPSPCADVPSGLGGRGTRLRETDRHDARAPGLSPAGAAGRSRDADEVLSAGPDGRRLRSGHPAGALAAPRVPGVSVPRGRLRRAACPPERRTA